MDNKKIHTIYQLKRLLISDVDLNPYRQAMIEFINSNAFDVWSIDDVKSIDDTLSDEQCSKILNIFEAECDSEIGLTWAGLENVIKDFKN